MTPFFSSVWKALPGGNHLNLKEKAKCWIVLFLDSILLFRVACNYCLLGGYFAMIQKSKREAGPFSSYLPGYSKLWSWKVWCVPRRECKSFLNFFHFSFFKTHSFLSVRWLLRLWWCGHRSVGLLACLAYCVLWSSPRGLTKCPRYLL